MEAFTFDLQRFATGSSRVSLNNTMSAVTFSGTANDEVLTNSGESVTINGNGGRDLIKNRNANYVLINGGNDANVIWNGYVERSQSIPGGSFVTINGGDGDDYIYSGMLNEYTAVRGGNDILINAGAGDDFVFNIGNNVTINGGAGKNNITGYGNRLSIDVGADDDKISLRACSLVTINAGEGNNSISVDGYGSIECAFITINAGTGNDSISVYGRNFSINAGEGNDIISSGYGGSNTTINAGAGNDGISNYGEYSLIDSGDGNDKIYNDGSNSTIDTGEGDDEIHNSGSNSIIDTGEGDDYLRNGGDGSTIYTGEGDDGIFNSGSNTTINAGAGNDTIGNGGSNSTINTGEGDDSIGNGGDGSTIYTGEGDDTIDNDGYWVSINTGLGNDSVFNDGNLTTINTGAGNDTIQNIYGDSVTIDAGSGNDYIYLFHDAEKISINAGSGDDTLNNDGAFNNVTFHGDEGNDYINNSGSSIEAYGDEGDDYISNGGEDVSVTGGEGSDTIYNGGEYSFIDGGNGDDYISNSAGGTNVFSYKPLAKATVTGGAGNDTIRNSGNSASLNGGDGDDIFELESNGKNATVDCTSGNDTIKVNGENVFALVGFGLGDVIELSQAENILRVFQGKVRTGGLYTQFLTLDNIDSLEKEQVTWQLDEDTNSATAVRVNTKLTLSADKKHITYEIDPNDEPEEIFTISGLKAGVTLADLQANVTVDDTQVTVNEKVLGNSDVTISDGYTLALASTVPKPKTTTNECNISSTDDTSTVIYTAGGATGGYTLDDNKIVYGEGTGGTFKLTGLAKDFGADDMTVDGKQILLSANALGNSNVTLTTDDDYTLALDDDCPTVTAFDKGWKLDGTTATLHNAGKTDGYRLMTTAKAVTYLRATGGKALLTVSGLSDGLSVVDGAIDGLTVEDKTLTVTPEVVGENFSVSKGYKVVFDAGNYSGSKFTGTAGRDTLEVNGSGLIVDGGAGNDAITSGGSNELTGGRGNDTFVAGGGTDTITDYGVGADKISLTADVESFSINGSDVVLNFDDGKSMTIVDGAGKKIYFLQNGRSTTEIFKTDGKLSSNGKSITLASTTTDYEASDAIVTINGSLTDGVQIFGNGKNNKIFGGDGSDILNGSAGKDTLTGGDGSDIFVFESGKDVITDYADDDKISLTAATTSETLNSKGDVVLKFGSDSLTIKKVGDTDGRTIVFAGDDNDDTTKIYFSEKIVGDDGVTLQSNFSATTFAATKDLPKVDASATKILLTLTGGDENNTLIGGTKANVLDGGKGNDILIGNGGNDTFVYSAGNDTISDYESRDKISLTSAIQSYDLDGDDVIIGFGDGSLTIADAANSSVTFVETSGATQLNVFASEGIFNSKQTAVTLNAATESYTAPTNIVSIDGGLVTGEIEIVGNAKANHIHAGDFGSTLNGGAKNDSLWGGAGSDTFIYESGGGQDIIYGFGDGDALQLEGKFTASFNGDDILFKVGSVTNAVTLKDFTATSFNVNGDTYQISGSNFVKKD